MSACIISAECALSTPLDDEIAALALQIEELDMITTSRKGKYPFDHPPDFELAFASFQEELEKHKTVLGDRKFAQSMGAAVHTDEAIIDNITAQETESHADHHLAVQLSTDDVEMQALPCSMALQAKGEIEDWMSIISGTVAAHSVLDFSDEETEAGPSMTYLQRQAESIKKMAMEYDCIACTDRFPRSNMVTAHANHRYCTDCVRSLFMRSTKDEGLYPPKCCKQPIPLTLVARHLKADELALFQVAAVEFSTSHRVYCSDLDCAKFIIPNNINESLQLANCLACGTETCSICTNRYHYGSDCPDDPSLRQTRELARSLGWQTCKACKRVVQLRSGCNHITCVCSAEFCYVCGIEWKNCRCATADIERIEERAEEIVERDAPANLAPHQRRAQFDQIFADLQENHECEHSRRFQRKEWGAPRRGFRCELCDARHHKYILQCRRCYVNVCEECRRNRI